jgi:hypothetical protein
MAASLKAANDAFASMSKSAADAAAGTLAYYEKLGVTSKKNKEIQEARKALGQEVNKIYVSQIKNLESMLKNSKDLNAVAQKKIKQEIDILNAQKEQFVLVKKLQAAAEQASKDRQKEIADLKAIGRESAVARARAASKEWSDQHFGEKGSRTGEGVAAGAINLAKDPRQVLQMMGGPWGVILNMIVDVIDGIRKTRSELMSASAASGHFADGLGQANKEAIALNKSQAEFAAMGMDVGEVTEVYKSLKKTGISALGTVASGGKVWGAAMSSMAMDTIAFSKASGEAYDVVTSRFASFIRNFGIAKNDVSAKYFSILKQATAVAQKGVMTVEDYMKGVESLSDAFKDVGVNVSQVSNILGGVSKVMENMGRPLANIQKVAQGILGISKASEGWQVFMAKMSGVAGGYAQSLFAAQQRGPGGSVTQAGKFDAMKMIQQARGAILQPTAGIGDAATRQLMVERMGQQFGMDTETTQVFQQLSAGTISQEEAATTLTQLHEAAKKNNLDSKGMFDIIRGILVGVIAKPIVMIYEMLQNFLGSKETGDSSIMKTLDSLQAGGNATGGIIKSGGMIRVHAQEAIVGNKIYPAAQVSPLPAGGIGGGGGNLNLSFNLQISEENLKSQFREMENRTLGYLKQQQRGNFVG